MIARLAMLLPFNFAVPEAGQFHALEYEEGGYVIREYPPARTEQPPKGPAPETITLDGVPAFIANGLRIDFHKDSFDRTEGGAFDPPRDFITRCVERLLNRLRFLSSAPQIRIHTLRSTSWRLQYLKDDGTEFEKAKGFVRARFSFGFSVSIVALTPGVWDQMCTLGSDFEPPVWNTLLLDACDLMPNIGAAVTLTATALEVCIAHVLDRLAKTTSVPGEMWKWINEREWLKQPSIEEQFDQLLKILSGHSLKEDATLWEAFKHVRGARNTFVHEGSARIGKDAVTETVAAQLIGRATEIIKKIRLWLPEEMRWPEPNVQVTMNSLYNFSAMLTKDGRVHPSNAEPQGPVGAETEASD